MFRQFLDNLPVKFEDMEKQKSYEHYFKSK